jgi:hypothetical protein
VNDTPLGQNVSPFCEAYSQKINLWLILAVEFIFSFKTKGLKLDEDAGLRVTQKIENDRWQ